MSQPTTLGALRDTGYRSRSVKTEIRENLLDRLRSGETAFPGIVGFDDTVLPQLESALLAGHDLVLLGERGQGKTRLMRTIGQLLDEWTPVVEGCEINDDPMAPVCARCRKLAGRARRRAAGRLEAPRRAVRREAGHPGHRVGDLVGDVDPVKVAEGRTLGDPETVHYGLLPRTNRGIFGINELPDLAERIQVAMFNVLEERDIQVRGYSLRLPIDVLLVASAPTPRTTPTAAGSSPRSRTASGPSCARTTRTRSSEEVALVAQEARARRRRARAPARGGRPADPRAARVAVGRPPLRGERPVRDRRGRGRRRLRAAPRRPHRRGRARWPGCATCRPWSRRCSARSSSRWARRAARPRSSQHLLRVAVAETFRARLGGLDLSGFTELFAEGATRRDRRAACRPRDLLDQVGTVPGLSKVLDRLGHGDDASPGRGGRGDRVRARGAAPDPPHRQGVGRPGVRSTGP